MLFELFTATAEHVVQFVFFRLDRRGEVSIEGLLENLLVGVVALFLYQLLSLLFLSVCQYLYLLLLSSFVFLSLTVGDGVGVVESDVSVVGVGGGDDGFDSRRLHRACVLERTHSFSLVHRSRGPQQSILVSVTFREKVGEDIRVTPRDVPQIREFVVGRQGVVDGIPLAKQHAHSREALVRRGCPVRRATLVPRTWKVGWSIDPLRK